MALLKTFQGAPHGIELVSGEENQYIAYVAYPLDLFEEGSVTNILTSVMHIPAKIVTRIERSSSTPPDRSSEDGDRLATM